MCTGMPARAGCGRGEGCEHQQLVSGGQMGRMRDRGETADASNPHPAEACVGVMGAGQPLMMQLQRLND